jgi:aminopeptidase N
MQLKTALFSFLSIAVATQLSTSAFAAAPEGIPRDLARQRAAAISDVRYAISFTLAPKTPTAAGHEDVRFSLTSPQAVLLDYRDGDVLKIAVNGKVLPAPMPIENGHIALPADTLRAGENTVTIDFVSNIAPANKPLIRYEDKDDGTEYVYTLFVPMDASMAFPCFDQPDLKAKFKLALNLPGDWTAISNTEASSHERMGGAYRVEFDETKPISTYLFAFAAGHFKKIERAGLPSIYVRQSKLERAQSEAQEVQETAQHGIEHLSKFFAQPFPFPKYDMVLIPGFAYGGMEHAGATFLREESVLFRTAPTHTDHIGRKLLVLHELTHQWFGDLTTMRWFDDLWLKEGFAQYMAYETLATLEPNENIWKRFYESIKPGAHAIDSTKGTTPIYQDIPNLKDAKSAYGAIVYSKAPGVLKQLAFVVGDEHFRDGLRIYLKEHLYANAEWSDLVHALERASGQKLDRWSEMWIKHRGMPQVDVDWACADGKISRFTVTQKDVLGEGGLWPIATQAMLAYGTPQRIKVQFDTARTDVEAGLGKPCPAYVFANDQDFGYGRYLLDGASRDRAVSSLETYIVSSSPREMQDPFHRALILGSLWEGVRVADYAPRDFVTVAERVLPVETDESLTQSLAGRATAALHRYVSDSSRKQLVPALEELAADKMAHSNDEGLRIIWFRGLRGVAETDSGRAKLKDLLAGKLTVPGVQLRQLDRWNLVTSLIAMHDPDADAIFKAEQQRDRTGDGLKYAYVAEAARPDAATKKKYFDDFLHNPQRPEDWVDQALGAFNYWNQSELTAPYLRPALDALPQIKRERKIFFLVAWLNAFIDGQRSAESDRQVYDFLDSAKPEPDLRLKILQSVDELDRTVKIRAKFPE